MQTTDRPSMRTTNVADLQAEAKALGVDVDQRWGPARLQREIDAAKAKKAESETPNPAGSLESEGQIVNVGSTAAPVYERRKEQALKVNGPLTHARFAAEAARIVRRASRWVAHETLRLHTGEHAPGGLVSNEDRAAFLAEMTESMRAIEK